MVLEASSLPDEELEAFLQSMGLDEIHLEQWRPQMLNGLHDKASSKKTTKKNAPIKEVKEQARKEKALAEVAVLLFLKKSQIDLGGRGRRQSREERKVMLEPVDEDVASGARLGPSAQVLGLSARTIIRWRKQQGGEDRPRGPHKPPPNRLSESER